MTSRRRRLAIEGGRSRTDCPDQAWRALLIAGAAAILAIAGLWPASATAEQRLECTGNLVHNGGFEAGFSGRARMAETVAVGWSAWYERFPGTNGINYVPDYSPAQREATSADGDAFEGIWSQEIATQGATHTAGLWQRFYVTEASTVTARVMVYAWASDGGNPSRSEPPGTYLTSLGLDPTGGTDANAPTVRWTTAISVTDAWVPLLLETAVDGGPATLFLRGQPLRVLRSNLSRWDDACVQVVGPADRPRPTATRAPRPSSTTAPGTPSQLPSPTATSDPSTQTALDVALFVDAAATSQGATAQAERAAASSLSEAGAAPADRAGQPGGVLPGGGSAVWRPEGWGLPAEVRAGHAGDSPLAWDSRGARTAAIGYEETSRWEALVSALADRAGIAFLGLAALLAGALIGTARRGRGNTGGGE